ncbi:MAG: hypothetical protein NT094_02165 [Candidatus Staskawiczbacteria bacterium]|nr:hypothetical protein [Candidatus Staskawiczbacteria bacterium]
MDKYPIPQFIEAEGKIAFFISFRQFFYLCGAGLACFFLYFFLPRVIFYLVAFVVFVGTSILAFGTMSLLIRLNQ